jgi:hypothetical protein
MTTQLIINAKVEDIRDIVNNPRKHRSLYKNNALYPQMCSALDVISDTEEAILAFQKIKFNKDRATLYLALYGVLQAIYVQQDAVINLCQSLGIDKSIKDYPRLSEIRDIRNDSVGHPTKRDPKTRGGPTSYSFIAPQHLDTMEFDMVSMLSDGTSEQRHVNLLEIMEDQQKYLLGILTMVQDKLHQEEREHKEKFRMEKLIEIFHSASYWSEKLTYAVHGSSPPDLGTGSLKNIKEIIINFKKAVKRRDKAYYESLLGDFELIEFAISRLQEFFQLQDWSEEDIKTAKIFNSFLQNAVAKLKQIAQEIDIDYAEVSNDPNVAS